MNSDYSPEQIKLSVGLVGLLWYHWLAVCLSLMLTFGAFYFTEQQVQLKSVEAFKFQSQQILELVQERMSKYEEALWAGVSAIQMFPGSVSRVDWRIFSDSLDINERFPGINGIGVIHFVPPEKLSAYLDWQRETYSDYDIHPTHKNKEFWPITYVEPEAINLKAIGLDIAHEKNRFTAAQKARATGRANITGPIVLVQDAQQTPGFLFLAPWFAGKGVKPTYGDISDGFEGLVYAPFIMYKLMDGTLENINRLVNFSIHDGDTELYSELTFGSENYDPEPVFSNEVTLELYGRPWRFSLQSTLLFRQQQSHTQPIIILVGGIVIDVLLLTIFMILTRSNQTAIQYAKRVTKRLEARKEELENVSKNLELRNHELEEANAELDQFAFVASHDLKAPLRGINQLAQWIEEDTEETLSQQTREYLNLMKNRISRLERLLNDLLAYSRVGRKEVKLEEVDINTLVKDVFTLLNHEGRFTLKFEGLSETVFTMVTPLELVLRNLFSNSIKHHDKDNGIINVTVSRDQQWFLFSVTDDGPGIPVEHQQKVFDLFHTLKPRDQVEGSGLGLSIIKKILERYGCHYKVQSDGERGMTFKFCWPVRDSYSEGETPA
ncbi:MAG: CHASE domain-containing protein [Reinekea sp.]